MKYPVKLQPLDFYKRSHPFVFSLFWFPFFLFAILWAFGAILRRKLRPPPYRSKIHTWCVGNLTSGGSGKTPLVRALSELLNGSSPAILSRGYLGESEFEGGIVGTAHPNGAKKYGDEPWMLAHQTGCQVYVGRDRIRSVKNAEANGGIGELIFDDGFQNTQVHYDEALLLWDAEDSSRHCLPLGALREPIGGMARATAIILAKKGRGLKLEISALPEAAQKLPCFHAEFVVQGPFDSEGNTIEIHQNVAIGAFCGIANPDSFFDPLCANYNVVGRVGHPDHFWYTHSDIDLLNQQAVVKGMTAFVTTEKDWYRLGKLRDQFRVPLYWFGLKIAIENSFSEYVVQKAVR